MAAGVRPIDAMGAEVLGAPELLVRTAGRRGFRFTLGPALPTVMVGFCALPMHGQCMKDLVWELTDLLPPEPNCWGGPI